MASAASGLVSKTWPTFRRLLLRGTIGGLVLKLHSARYGSSSDSFRPSVARVEWAHVRRFTDRGSPVPLPAIRGHRQVPEQSRNGALPCRFRRRSGHGGRSAGEPNRQIQGIAARFYRSIQTLYPSQYGRLLYRG